MAPAPEKKTGICHLGDVLQPSAQCDEHEEHGRSVEKGDGALAGALGHGDDQDHTGVDVGDGGGQHNEHVHVGSVVFQRAVRLDVEVATAEDLQARGSDHVNHVTLMFLD